MLLCKACRWAVLGSRTTLVRCLSGVAFPRLASRTLQSRALVISAEATVPARRFAATEAASPGDSCGEAVERREFQAETRMLLDIVARSLYSNREVFVRELISNASDALERLRLHRLQQDDGADDAALEIRISTDKAARTITIEDSGIGMTRDELVNNLGTIARSGSKAFLREMKDKDISVDSIIGQFGVGFYSAFMVADSVEVFSRSVQPGSRSYHWTSDGAGFYQVKVADEEQPVGTRVVVHLKSEDTVEFADSGKVKDIIKKYSNFVGSPIVLDGERVNTVQATWAREPRSVSAAEHDAFFKFVAHAANDRPRYTLHFKAEAPLSLAALLYVPTTAAPIWLALHDNDCGVALYSRRVLIEPRANSLLPRWLRFLKGVVDSEDIPLNLSRELLQKGALITKLKQVVSGRVLKFLLDESKKDPTKFLEFYRDFSFYLKEGIMSTDDQSEKEDIAKLLLFDSSNFRDGVKVSLQDYVGRMQEDQRAIYYLHTPSRELAESSPYFEAFKSKQVEVLFAYDSLDELALIKLMQFDGRNLTSVEKWLKSEPTEPESQVIDNVSKADRIDFLDWAKLSLGSLQVHDVKVTTRLSKFPCMISTDEMGAARYFVSTQHEMSPEQRAMLLKPTLEINTAHPLMRHLAKLRKTDAALADLVLQQVYDNAMVAAGLLGDPRRMTLRLNELMTRLMDKYDTDGSAILKP